MVGAAVVVDEATTVDVVDDSDGMLGRIDVDPTVVGGAEVVASAVIVGAAAAAVVLDSAVETTADVAATVGNVRRSTGDALVAGEAIVTSVAVFGRDSEADGEFVAVPQAETRRARATVGAARRR